MSDKKLYGSPAIGERLKELLEEWKETQDSLAQKISNETGEKVSRATVAKWISGDRDIPASDLAAICKCYNVSANYLLFGVGHTLSIDPDVSAAVKYTGLSEESLFIIADLAENTYTHVEWNGNNSFTRTECDNAPLLNRFILHGMEKILSELQDYSDIALDAKKFLQNARNFLSSPYSNSTAARSMAVDGKFLLKNFRFQSLSLGETSKSVGDAIFEAEKIRSDLQSVIDELNSYSYNKIKNELEGSETK